MPRESHNCNIATGDHMSNSRFSSENFFAALDSTRIERQLTWKQVAAQADVSASTLTRMGQGKRPDVDSLAALASWAQIDVANFYINVKIGTNKTETLAKVSALLRADAKLAGGDAEMLEAMIKAAYESMRSRREKAETS